MGTWGTAIFADDVASDVRGDFRNFLADAQSLHPATDAIVEAYGARFDDLSTDTAFWLGLALTQWRMGRLDPRVKDAALQIIDGGLDLKLNARKAPTANRGIKRSVTPPNRIRSRAARAARTRIPCE